MRRRTWLLAIVLTLATATPSLAQATGRMWNVPFATQIQPGWTLANSSVSYSQYGCYATALWMMMRGANAFTGELEAWNRFLDVSDACEPDGRLRGRFQRETLRIVRDDAPSETKLQTILASRPVIVESLIRFRDGHEGQHFFVVYGYTMGASEPIYFCHDPLGKEGDQRTYQELRVISLHDLSHLEGAFATAGSGPPAAPATSPVSTPIPPRRLPAATNPVTDLREQAARLERLTSNRPTLAVAVCRSAREVRGKLVYGRHEPVFSRQLNRVFVVLEMTNLPRGAAIELTIHYPNGRVERQTARAGGTAIEWQFAEFDPSRLPPGPVQITVRIPQAHLTRSATVTIAP